MLPYFDVIFFVLSVTVFLLFSILAGRCTRPQEVRRYLNLTRTLTPARPQEE